jgi:tetratricopeptide (TPR) repeat protein
LNSLIFHLILLPLLLAGAGPSLFEKARNCEAAGDWAGAEAAYRGFLQTAPASAEGWTNLGVVLARQERFEAAIQAYRKALRIRPGLAPVRLDLGLAYYKTGNRAAAIREFRLSLQKDRSNRQVR